MSDLRYRMNLHIISLHNDKPSAALIMSANEHHNFKELFKPIPTITSAKPDKEYKPLVKNLPTRLAASKVKILLKELISDCGGFLVTSVKRSTAIMKFKCETSAQRAKSCLDGKKMHNNKISVEWVKYDKSNQMKDIGIVSEDPTGKIPSLNPDHGNTPSSFSKYSSES
ncbi:hypothetical protein HCN44_004721 [Aphidius gifuensis]|uniref:RRM domain-containing protein n=1 Tax=Aphidius gifuensis TaxID=684658 RepID=A0A835CSQ7_APHGI|nr:hypothetical protein HCN44_004721 [Aphidius gifuensis]